MEKTGYRRKICKSCRTARITAYRSGPGKQKGLALAQKFRDDHPGYYEKYLSEERLAQMKVSRDAAVQRNREYLIQTKSVPCADCERTYPPYVMDFDHVRGEKIREVSTMVGCAQNLETIKTEIAKCDVVCANCHRVRTYERGVKNGTRKQVA